MREWWQRSPLRFRLALWYSAGGTLLLLLFSATLYFYVRQQMAQPIDSALKKDLSLILKNVDVSDSGVVTWKGQVITRDTHWPWENPWFEIWDDKGKLVVRLWPLVEKELQRVPTAPMPGRETIAIYNVSPDIRLRILTIPFSTDTRKASWMIRVMNIHYPAEDALTNLLLIMAIALPLVIVLLVTGGYFITKHWLRPLGELAAIAEKITAHDLSRRLPVSNPHDEIGRLAGSFNDTLSRLENSFVTMDRFVGNASHELRTPLTTLRSVGEVALSRTRSADEYREVIGSMLEESHRLQLLIERLLQLALIDGGAQQVKRSPVRIDRVVSECADDMTVLAEEKKQRILLQIFSCELNTDETLFRQALQNLIDNAIKYSPEETTITVGVKKEAGEVSVVVEDEGCGIEPEHRDMITDRFFRANALQGQKSKGYGLGLDITKAYMRVLGGRLVYVPREPHGSRFHLVLPA